MIGLTSTLPKVKAGFVEELDKAFRAGSVRLDCCPRCGWMAASPSPKSGVLCRRVAVELQHVVVAH